MFYMRIKTWIPHCSTRVMWLVLKVLCSLVWVQVVYRQKPARPPKAFSTPPAFRLSRATGVSTASYQVQMVDSPYLGGFIILRKHVCFSSWRLQKVIIMTRLRIFSPEATLSPDRFFEQATRPRYLYKESNNEKMFSNHESQDRNRGRMFQDVSNRDPLLPSLPIPVSA